MGTYTILAQRHERAVWLHRLCLAISVGAIGVACWYAAPWVAGPFSWLVDTVIPAWIAQQCICAL
jgi:hypothetical protein